MRQLSLLGVFCCLFLTACEPPELSLYTRSLDSDYVEVLDPGSLKGIYQVLGYNDSSQGLLRISQYYLPLFQSWKIELGVDRPESQRGPKDVLQFSRLFRADGRLFLEYKVSTSFLGATRYGLLELAVTPDRLILMPMVFNKERLATSGLSFRMAETGGIMKAEKRLIEVANRPHHAMQLLGVMEPQRYGLDVVEFRPTNYAQTMALRIFIRKSGITFQDREGKPDRACTEFLASEGYQSLLNIVKP